MNPILNAPSAGIISVTQPQDRGCHQGTSGNGWLGRLINICSDVTAFLDQALSDAPNPAYYLVKKPAVMLCGGLALVAGAGGSTPLSQPGLSANSSALGNPVRYPDPYRLIPTTSTGYPNTPDQAAADGEPLTTLDRVLDNLPDQAREISSWAASESYDPDDRPRNREKRQASNTGPAAASKLFQLFNTYQVSIPGQRQVCTKSNFITSISWSPDSDRIGLGIGFGFSQPGGKCPHSGRVQIVKMTRETFSIVCTLTDATDWVRSVNWSPDGTLLAAGAADSTVRIYNGTAPGSPLYTLTDAANWVFSVNWSPDGTLLAAGDWDGTVRIYNGTAPGSPLYNLTEATDRVISVSWSPDGTLLATGGADRTVRIYNGTAPGSPLYNLTDATYWVYSVNWSPDGTLLAAGSLDSVVRIYNGTDFASPLHNLTEATDGVLNVNWSPDGTFLATGGKDSTVRIYNGTAPGSPLHNLTDATKWVFSVNWSPDGQWLATGGEDGKLRIYNSTAAKSTTTAAGLIVAYSLTALAVTYTTCQYIRGYCEGLRGAALARRPIAPFEQAFRQCRRCGVGITDQTIEYLDARSEAAIPLLPVETEEPTYGAVV